MSPKDFYNRYKNLTVSCTGPDGAPAAVSASIWRYVINNKLDSQKVIDPKTGEVATDPRTGKEKTVAVPSKDSDVYAISQKVGEVQSAFNAYVQRLKKPGAAPANAAEALALSSVLPQGFLLPARIQYGKGTPDDMETVLKAGLLCGKLAAWGPQRRDQYVAARFAQDYFGIDCTGFANAYFYTEGKMSAKDVVSNWWDLGCPWLYNYAKNHGNGILWTQEIAEKKAAPVIVWMVEAGGTATESRKPGHISVINEVTISGDGATLDCYESNGGVPKDDPRNMTRVLVRAVNENGARYWLTNNNEKVLVIRPWT